MKKRNVSQTRIYNNAVALNIKRNAKGPYWHRLGKAFGSFLYLTGHDLKAIDTLVARGELAWVDDTLVVVTA